MASYQAVCTAGFIHFVFGISVYLSQPTESCSPAPKLGGWIFLGALGLLATDIKMYPDRYLHLPYAIQFLVETTGSLAILEFFSNVVWCTLEQLIHHLVRLLVLSLGMNDELYLALEYWLLLIPTTALAGSLFAIMKMAILPLFDIKSIYRKQETKVHLDKDVYIDLVSQNMRKLEKYNRRYKKELNM
ncbi:uncharacterized protein LOC108025017 [Drosophila biarmipes]|uniref:uncharacterized protein LOC108025017 n=1 Tax=Drosophila biarmipes TaxID=125945 RepID=UPI0007E80A1A|nr:uncharacterized protein LOC108025017 [Drosophila biarmipes]